MKPITRRALLATGGAAALAAGVGAYKLARPGGAIVPGVSRAKPVLGRTTIPQKADVVIIGGGYVGCHAALDLAERGISAALCEKGVIAGEASGRSAGLITSLYLDPIKLDLILRSKQLWAGMNERVEADTGYRKPGQLTLFRNPPEQRDTEAWLSTVDPVQREPAQFLSTAEIKKRVRQGAEQWSGALWSPEEATAEPTLACPAIAAAAIRKGAAVIQQCAARGIETSGGKVSAVVTEKGTIATSAVILAGGVWSPFFARSLGLELPQFNAYSSMINVAPFDGPSITMFGNDVCLRQTPDGGYYAFTTNGTAPITPTTLRYLPQLLPSLTHLWDELDPVFSPSTFMREWSIPAQWRVLGQAIALRESADSAAGNPQRSSGCRHGAHTRDFPGLCGRQGARAMGRGAHDYSGQHAGDLGRPTRAGALFRHRHLFRTHDGSRHWRGTRGPGRGPHPAF